MSWNENIKKILDFIPVFEANSGRIEFLEKSNLELSKEIGRLKDEIKRKPEPAKPEVIKEVIDYDDSELKLSLKCTAESIKAVQDKISEMATSSQLNLLDKQFKSFAASSNDEANRKADSALRKAVKAVEIAKSVNMPEPYDDTEIKKEVATLQKSNQNMSSKLKHDVEDLKGKISSISEYDDTDLKRSVGELSKVVNEIKQAVGSITEYDDEKIKGDVDSLRLRAERLDKSMGEIKKELTEFKKAFEVK